MCIIYYFLEFMSVLPRDQLKKSRLRDGIKQFKKEAKKIIKTVLERMILVLTHKNESGVKVPTKVTNPASYESACKGENLKWSAGNSLVR